MTRLIVCDTGPLLHLSEAGAVGLLSQAGDIPIPPLMAIEFEANAQGWNLPQRAKIIELDEFAKQKAERLVESHYIDGGEAQAISLALQMGTGWLITDDAKARQVAEAAGLEVHGSIGILIWSVAVGHIRDQALALHLLDNLANSSLWISRRVLQEAQRAIDALFE